MASAWSSWSRLAAVVVFVVLSTHSSACGDEVGTESLPGGDATPDAAADATLDTAADATPDAVADAVADTSGQTPGHDTDSGTDGTDSSPHDGDIGDVLPPYPTLDIGPGQGLDLVAGVLVLNGTCANSDIYATNNGGKLRLASGGDSPVKSRPVTWFLTGSGTPKLFGSLDAVPDTIPTEDSTSALPEAVAGGGFVVETHDGSYVKGWMSNAIPVPGAGYERLAIQFVSLPEPGPE